MVFRKLDGTQMTSALLLPRSGIVLKDAGRYAWNHEIPARKSDIVDGMKVARGRRISLTFRSHSPR
jgi:alkylated DNA repair dioxygenase AlkB